MASQELLQGLNEALNREVSTFLKYMLQVSSIKGAEWASARTLYHSEIPDEMGHAQYLSDKIVMLGGAPKLAPDLTPPPPGPRAMLEADIEQERIDAEHYTRLARLAEEEGLVELKLKLEEIAADEVEHGESMRRLMG